jgi:hypothetical protein
LRLPMLSRAHLKGYTVKSSTVTTGSGGEAEKSTNIEFKVAGVPTSQLCIPTCKAAITTQSLQPFATKVRDETWIGIIPEQTSRMSSLLQGPCDFADPSGMRTSTIKAPSFCQHESRCRHRHMLPSDNAFVHIRRVEILDSNDARAAGPVGNGRTTSS